MILTLLWQIREKWRKRNCYLRNCGRFINFSVSDADIDFVLYGDEGKLCQILTNLTSNALKFTRDGDITLGFYADEKIVHFFVKDTGVGIPEEFLDTIFDRFIQLHQQGAGQHSGMGLGLAIC